MRQQGIQLFDQLPLQLRDRLNDIAISTIDAFCLSLLREFPLEADLDPGFEVADATEVPRLVEESLDDALRICRARARDEEAVALLMRAMNEAKEDEEVGELAMLLVRTRSQRAASPFTSAPRSDAATASSL